MVPPSPLTNQPACKPGSVGRRADALRVTAIPLERRLPGASSNLPGRQDLDTYLKRAVLRQSVSCRPYSVLLPVGFAMPPTLPPARCALTAPFHPCRGRRCNVQHAGRFVFCGTVPGVAPAGRYPAPYVHGARTFLPGDLSILPERPSSRLTERGMGCGGGGVKGGTSPGRLRPAANHAACIRRDADRVLR